MNYSLKQLLSAILCLVLLLGLLMCCTGCVSTPEPWRADLRTPDGKVNGAVREFAYMHKSYLPIMDGNMTVRRFDPDWNIIAAKNGYGAKYPILWK